MSHVSCSTHSASPRKHAQPEPGTNPELSVTLGNGLEDRQVNAKWNSGDISAMVSIDVATLRKMLAEAEAYKPGATLSRPVVDLGKYTCSRCKTRQPVGEIHSPCVAR